MPVVPPGQGSGRDAPTKETAAGRAARNRPLHASRTDGRPRKGEVGMEGEDPSSVANQAVRRGPQA